MTKAEKITLASKEIELDIKDVTLLSVEEALKIPKNVLVTEHAWWLRTPGYDFFYAAVVYGDGLVYDFGNNVAVWHGVRPALEIRNLESFDIGDKIKLADELFTVISSNMALCDRAIGSCAFRRDWQEKDANDYEKSDVKVYLQIWARDKFFGNEEDKYGDSKLRCM